MNNLKIIPSTEINRKIEAMNEALQGYWADDRWDVRKCPLKSADAIKDKPLRNRWINFDYIENPWLRTELKFFYYFNMVNNVWKPKTVWIRKGTVINNLIGFLDTNYPDISSISEVPLNRAITKYRMYLLEKGIKITTINKKLNSKQEIIKVEADNYYITNLKQFIKFYQDYYFDGDEWEKDIWDKRKLNLSIDQINISQYEYSINFSQIKNPYFKKIIKRFCKLQLNINSFSTCKNYATYLRVFYNFLNNKYPHIKKIENIERSIIEDYFSYLLTKKLSAHTINSYKSSLNKLFETMQLFDWEDAPTKRLIFPEDYQREIKLQPRYIDEYVLEQLNRVIDKLPEDIAIMTLIIQECGMRISELCTLKKGCLLQDKEKDWFLKYYQGKMKKEHIIPISKEIADLIHKQEEKINCVFKDSTEYLFPREDGSPLKQSTFRDILNELAFNENIRDRNGNLFRFQAHAFRHTVGTRMINNGVPQYIVQRFLGHESPEMTMRYAHIHDATMKEYFSEFRKKLVNNQGIPLYDDETDDIELQWFKQNINAQVLPNGYCRLPVFMGECPHANACLDCTHFCTNKDFIEEHKKQLNKTKEILEVASKNHWQRQVETNLKIKEKLEMIIAALDSGEKNGP